MRLDKIYGTDDYLRISHLKLRAEMRSKYGAKIQQSFGEGKRQTLGFSTVDERRIPLLHKFL